MKTVAPVALVAALLSTAAQAAAQEPAAKPQVMIVGVAHLVAKHDLHNATWRDDALAAPMQSQIADVVSRLAAFKPTKVMIEASAADPKYVQRYKAYLAGTYQLGPNENDQLGYRLAAVAHNPTIYPIDEVNFTFDYPSVVASAKRNGQNALLAQAEAAMQPLVERSNALEQQDRLRDLLRFLNTPEALDANAAWYMYVNRVGTARDFAGAGVVTAWYARNLHILANITRELQPGDRAVVFIGQGHAALLRPWIKLSPFLEDVDPEPFL
ncbi:MAG: hypothetical protein JO324_07455 [Candidatus Eremiobacteraeota bacterium]|nr:hypothetical protein [Candidatus Eremiobacteraeota bacterium]